MHFKSYDQDSMKLVEQYFIFEFRDGSIKEISGKDNLMKTLRAMHYGGDTALMSIRAYADRL